MMKKRILLILALGFSGVAMATPCPRYIAERSSGLFYPQKNYRCYSTQKSAERAGFSKLESLLYPDLTGWWRWNLTLKSNSCAESNGTSSAATTFFLQMRQDNNGLFGALCPGEGTFVGPTPNVDPKVGFSFTAANHIRNDVTCGGDATVTYTFSAKRFDTLYSESKDATLTMIKTCDAVAQSNVRCRTEWRGKGGRETLDHRFWPSVPDKLGQLSQTCGQALTTCINCHGG